MRELGPRDRPREKMEQSGAGALGDNELVAVIVGHGTAGASALTIANRILSTSGGAHGLTRISRDELAMLPGVGEALASRIQAAVELGRRTLVPSHRERPLLGSPHEAARFLMPLYGAHPVERFGVLMLDTRHRLLRTRLLSVGSLDTSVVHPREVFREAVVAGAAAVIVFHNHPSGDPRPTREDVDLTRRLISAGTIIGIDVIDHVILGDAHYCSIREAECR
jgi:DNA repair protein RadC